MTGRRHLVLGALVLALALLVAVCGGDGEQGGQAPAPKPTADEFGSGYSQTRGQFRPNFRLLEAAADPAAMEALLLATARVDGYFAQFDHSAPEGPEQVNVFVDLFANPTGSSIAVKRAAEFVDAAEAASAARKGTTPKSRLMYARAALLSSNSYHDDGR